MLRGPQLQAVDTLLEFRVAKVEAGGFPTRFSVEILYCYTKNGT